MVVRSVIITPWKSRNMSKTNNSTTTAQLIFSRDGKIQISTGDSLVDAQHIISNSLKVTILYPSITPYLVASYEEEMKHWSSLPSARGSKVSLTSSKRSITAPSKSMAGASSARGSAVSTVVEAMAT